MTTATTVPDRADSTAWVRPSEPGLPGWWTSITVDTTDLEASIAAEAARLGIDLWWAWFNADDPDEATALLYDWGDQARVIVLLSGFD